MNVYMAAVYTNEYRKGSQGKRYENLTEHERELADGVQHILESYHYVHKDKYVEAMRRDGVKVFLDSGAFSAYTLGIELSVAAYCDYIHKNTDIIKVEDGVLMASVLDGIGDPLQTWRNQLEMEARGVRPLPCFHAGEDERYLEHYVANYDYITLGGMVGTSSKQLCIWLDRVWDKYLVDGSGNPKIKVHGFGITAVPIMERYPWHSCDSSSWIQSTSFGTIVEPEFGPLSISEKSPSRHDAGQHIANLSDAARAEVIARLERAGFTEERLATVYESRAAYNLWAFGEIANRINAAHSNTMAVRPQELF